MYSDMRYEHVVYQNSNLAMRIWQAESEGKGLTPDEIQKDDEQARKYKKYSHWHYHEEVEFLLVLRGEMMVFCPDSQYLLRKGDIAVFGSSEPHYTVQQNGGPLSYLVFQIDLRKYWDLSTMSSMVHFSEVMRPLSAINYIYRTNDDVRSRTAAIIQEIYSEMNDKRIGYDLSVSSRVKNMLLLLLRHDAKKQLHYNDNQLLERFKPVIDYVEEHLDEKLTVSELCGMTNMSYTHFIKTFKKAVGMSFTHFVVHKRIKKAEQQLLTSDASIAEVAESVGISNLGHFYELFRRFNDCSPKQFKDRLRGTAYTNRLGETP